MAYTPPISGSGNINFIDSGYTPPASGTLTINFVSTDYSPPESGELTINFTESGYTPPTSGSLIANFTFDAGGSEYVPPVSGALNINFTGGTGSEGGSYSVPESGALAVNFVEKGYTPPVSGSLTANFEITLAYTPPESGALTINFTLESEEGGDVNIYTPAFISNNVLNADVKYLQKIISVFDGIWNMCGSSITFQTVVLDIANNHGYAGYIGCRSIEFTNGASVNTIWPENDIDYTNGPETLLIENLFDTTESKTGSASSTNTWRYDNGDSNIRLIMRLVNPMGCDGIVINNYHSSGSEVSTTIGIKDVKITLTNDEVTDLSYNGIIPNGTIVFNGTVDKHIAADVIDDQDLICYFPDLITTWDEQYGELDPMTATYIEEYNFGEKINTFIEPWKAPLQNIFSEDYLFEAIWLKRNYMERYGEQVFFLKSEPYSDVSVIKKRFVEPYKKAYIPNKVFAELYNDVNIFSTTFDENWKLYESIDKIFDEKYAITTGEVFKYFNEQYEIVNYNSVKRSFDESYALLNSTAKYVTQETSITVNGEYVEFADVSLSMSNSAYLISGSVSLLAESDYTSCSLGDEVIVRFEGIPDIILFIESKNSSYEFGSRSYQLSVLSPTAKLDVPYTRKITKTFTTDIYASDLIQQLADIEGIVTDYRLIDWLIDADAISINNVSPISAIRTIVQAVGGIMQTSPNGSLILMSKFPVPVSQFDYVSPDVSYDIDEDLLSIAPSTKLVDGYNAYIVYNETSSDHSITLREEEVDESIKIIKGFRVPFGDGPFDLETSGGIDVTIEKDINPVTELIPIVEDDTDEEWEVVEFLDFAASTSYPIYSVVDYEWLSRDLGEFEFEEDGTLIATNQDQESGESLLKIKYNTKYWKWTVTCPDVKKVQFYVPEIEE